MCSATLLNRPTTLTVLLAPTTGDFSPAFFPTGSYARALVSGTSTATADSTSLPQFRRLECHDAAFAPERGAFLSTCKPPVLYRPRRWWRNCRTQPDALVLTADRPDLVPPRPRQPAWRVPVSVVLKFPPIRGWPHATLLVQNAGSKLIPGGAGCGPFAVTLYKPHSDGTFTILPGLRLPAGSCPRNIGLRRPETARPGRSGDDRAASDQVFVYSRRVLAISVQHCLRGGVIPRPSAYRRHGDKRRDIW